MSPCSGVSLRTASVTFCSLRRASRAVSRKVEGIQILGRLSVSFPSWPRWAFTAGWEGEALNVLVCVQGSVCG